MMNLKELSNKLIDFNQVVTKMNGATSKINIRFSDLEIIYIFSNLNIAEIDKLFSQFLLDNDLQKHHAIVNSFIKKLKFFTSFYKENFHGLNEFNFEELIISELKNHSEPIEASKARLKTVSDKLKELKSSIESSSYRDPDSVTQKLLENEEILKLDYKKLKNEYVHLESRKSEAISEYLKYMDIDFTRIYETFENVILLIELKSDEPSKGLETIYIDDTITSKIYFDFKNELFRNINVTAVHQILNLACSNSRYIIPKGYNTKFYYLIDQLDILTKENSKPEWKDGFLNQLQIDRDLYESNYKKSVSENASGPQRKFAEKVDEIFRKNN